VCILYNNKSGQNLGLGKETTRVLAAHNATVVMACRSLERGEAARQELIASLTPEFADIESRLILLPLDLGKLSSVRDFAVKFDELHLPCHFLIENAGVGFLDEFSTTQDGIEKQWGTNHLGHFYLARLLLPKLQEDPPSRVISVAGGAFVYVLFFSLLNSP